VKLTAIFERWHIGDGNYPALRRDQLVNLSFQVEPRSLARLASPKQGRFNQLKDAEYSFAGTVLKVYADPPTNQIAVIQAGGFRFYMDSLPPEAPPLNEGDSIEGNGRLLLDYYIWVEFLSSYHDPPNLFYPLRVTRIRSVKIPNTFISHAEKVVSGPTSLSYENYSTETMMEIEGVPNIEEEDWIFYLVDFDDSVTESASIALTFRSNPT
jgi:hypothetical protein